MYFSIYSILTVYIPIKRIRILSESFDDRLHVAPDIHQYPNRSSTEKSLIPWDFVQKLQRKGKDMPFR